MSSLALATALCLSVVVTDGDTIRCGSERIPDLLATPAAVRFLSCEPLLGPVEFPQFGSPYIDWVIVGGESGPGARPMHPDWAQSLVDQCKAAGVAVFVKQLSGIVNPTRPIHDIERFPEGLRVREFPA